jgi:dihydroxyacetone kinase-like predicted kinase
VLVSFDPAVSADGNATAMQEALDSVVTGAVTIASRDARLNGVPVEAGKWLGLAEGEAVAGGDTFDDAARAVLATLLREPRGVLTLLTGEQAPALDDLIADVRAAHPDLELDVHEGGQPHYPLLLAAE